MHYLAVAVLLAAFLETNAQTVVAASEMKAPGDAAQERCSGALEFLETSYGHQQSGMLLKTVDQIAADWDKALPHSDKTPGKCGKSAEDLVFLKKMFRSKFVAHAKPCANIIKMGGTKKWFFGSESDGAKFICNDFVSRGNCVVYSLGSRMDFSFEADIVSKLQCQVHTFDCTVGDPSADEMPRGVTFHPWCIGDKDELKPFHSDIFDSSGQQAQYYTMRTIMSILGHSYVDILKMDIERFEFPVLKTLACPDCFGQANIEFHLQNVNGIWGQAVSYKEWNDVWDKVICESGLRPFSYDNADCDCCCEYSFLNMRRTPNATMFFIEDTNSLSSTGTSPIFVIIAVIFVLCVAVVGCRVFAAHRNEKLLKEASKRGGDSSHDVELEKLIGRVSQNK